MSTPAQLALRLLACHSKKTSIKMAILYADQGSRAKATLWGETVDLLKSCTIAELVTLVNQEVARTMIPGYDLKDTRRNRRWVAIADALASYVIGRREAEEAAWTVVRAWEETR